MKTDKNNSNIYRLFPSVGTKPDLIIKDFYKKIPIGTNLVLNIDDENSKFRLGKNQFDIHDLVNKEHILRQVWLPISIQKPNNMKQKTTCYVHI